MKRHISNTNLILILLLASAMGTQAAINTNYGDHAGTYVTYTDVTEITDDGAYGAPSISGDTIDFDPSIVAEASNGAVVTNNALLSFGVAAHAGKGIQGVTLTERGVLTVRGFGGTDATFADVTAEFVVTIDKVNGTDVTDFTETFSMTFNPKEDGTWALGTDGSSENAEPWNGEVTLNFAGMLFNNGYNPDNEAATLAYVSLENVLIASTEGSTEARISKQDSDAFSITANVIPEPASAILLVGAASLLTVIRRRFIG